MSISAIYQSTVERQFTVYPDSPASRGRLVRIGARRQRRSRRAAVARCGTPRLPGASRRLGIRDLNPDYEYQKLACCQLHQSPTGDAGNDSDEGTYPPTLSRSESRSSNSPLLGLTSAPDSIRARAWMRSSERPTARAPATRPSFQYQAENSPSSIEPRTTTSSQSSAGPTYSRPVQSLRSLKK